MHSGAARAAARACRRGLRFAHSLPSWWGSEARSAECDAVAAAWPSRHYTSRENAPICACSPLRTRCMRARVSMHNTMLCNSLCAELLENERGSVCEGGSGCLGAGIACARACVAAAAAGCRAFSGNRLQVAGALFTDGGAAELAPLVHEGILRTVSDVRAPLELKVASSKLVGVKTCWDFTGVDESGSPGGTSHPSGMSPRCC
jgi:hypothetical protein